MILGRSVENKNEQLVSELLLLYSPSLSLWSSKEILSIHWTYDLSLSLSLSQAFVFTLLSQNWKLVSSVSSACRSFSSHCLVHLLCHHKESLLDLGGWIRWHCHWETGPLIQSGTWYITRVTLLIRRSARNICALQFNNEPNQLTRAVYIRLMSSGSSWWLIIHFPGPQDWECKQRSKWCVIKKKVISMERVENSTVQQHDSATQCQTTRLRLPATEDVDG